VRVPNPSKVPPGGAYHYVDPETGECFSHPYFGQLRTLATSHRTANGLPIPVNFDEQFEDNVCEHTPTAHCISDEENLSPAKLAARATRALANWAKSGFKVAQAEMIEERRKICMGDPATGIPTCSYWYGSSFLTGRCKRCGCSGRAKLLIRRESCPLGKWLGQE
jgi:hypothetical protein